MLVHIDGDSSSVQSQIRNTLQTLNVRQEDQSRLRTLCAEQITFLQKIPGIDVLPLIANDIDNIPTVHTQIKNPAHILARLFYIRQCVNWRVQEFLTLYTRTLHTHNSTGRYRIPEIKFLDTGARWANIYDTDQDAWGEAGIRQLFLDFAEQYEGHLKRCCQDAVDATAMGKQVPRFLGYSPLPVIVQAYKDSTGHRKAYQAFSTACEFGTFQSVDRLDRQLQDRRLRRFPYWMTTTGSVQSVQTLSRLDENDPMSSLEQSNDEEFFRKMQQHLQREHSQTVESKGNNPCRTGELLPHQLEVGFLLRPASPVHRLLVQHRIGSGKTRTMIHVLEQFGNDPRTKIVVCSSVQMCEQFLTVLKDLKSTVYPVKNSFRNQLNRGVTDEKYAVEISPGSGGPVDRNSTTACLFDCSSSSKGPLLVLTLDLLDGLLNQLRERPSANIAGTRIMLRGRGTGENPLSNKIILFDEFHKLFNSLAVSSRRVYANTNRSDDFQIVQNVTTHLDHVRDYLATTFGSVLGGFTATPPTEIAEVQELIRVLTLGTGKSLTGYRHHLNTLSLPTVFIKVIRNPILVERPDTKTISTIARIQACGVGPDVAQSIPSSPYYDETTCNVSRLTTTQRNYLVQHLDWFAPKISRMLQDLRTRKRTGTKNGLLILADEVSGIELVSSVLESEKIRYIRIDTKKCFQYDPDSPSSKDKSLDFEECCDLWNKFRKPSTATPDVTNAIPVIVLNVKYLKEGLDLLGIDTVYGLAKYANLTDMTQSFGRADRMCTQVNFATQPADLHMYQYGYQDDRLALEWQQQRQPPNPTGYGQSFTVSSSVEESGMTY